MVNWQITATTIYCDAVDDEVTILVSPDWTARCTGYQKFNANAGPLKKKSRQLKRQLACEGAQCPRVTGYKDKLIAEESAK